MIKFHDAKRRIEFAELKKEIGADQFEGENDEGGKKSSFSKKLKDITKKYKKESNTPTSIYIILLLNRYKVRQR